MNTSFFFLQWGLFFTGPRIEINGQVSQRSWGRSVFDLPAGNYTVRAFVPVVRRAVARGVLVHTPSAYVASEVRELFA